MSQTIQIAITFAFGVIFIATLIVLAIKFPHPTPFQHDVFRTSTRFNRINDGLLVTGDCWVRFVQAFTRLWCYEFWICNISIDWIINRFVLRIHTTKQRTDVNPVD